MNPTCLKEVTDTLEGLRSAFCNAKGARDNFRFKVEKILDDRTLVSCEACEKKCGEHAYVAGNGFEVGKSYEGTGKPTIDCHHIVTIYPIS